jgi:predicted enzyme related to lactoylglutathione lyase
MEVLSSRVLLRPVDLRRSLNFYRNTLGLAVYREFGTPPTEGVVFFLGGGFLEVSGHSDEPAPANLRLWLQVRDVDETWKEVTAAGAPALRSPVTEPWGLREAWIADPDGVAIGLIEVPADHPLRRR